MSVPTDDIKVKSVNVAYLKRKSSNTGSIEWILKKLIFLIAIFNHLLSNAQHLFYYFRTAIKNFQQ